MRRVIVPLVAGPAVLACAPAAAPTSARVPAPAVSVDASPAPVSPPPIYTDYCVLREGQLASVRIARTPGSDETTYEGRPVREVFPDTLPYARRQHFYINGEVLPFRGRPLTKFGVPRIVPADALVRVGEYEGAPLFAERGTSPGDDPSQMVLYVPVRPGCEFQLYQYEVKVRADLGQPRRPG